ncbi:MAG: cupin domain-containing protein, partial [Candidatus Phocaeicola faecipullorum]|nr:cupin domain-containing protein [Candidatus Phocaeicola faecipullorum]
NLGKLSQLNEYVLEMGPEIKIPGKVFCGTALGCTGSEFSFQMFRPGTETGFKHTHKNHEELYFFLSGKGEFQVDDRIFHITEGTVVRVSPDGKRSVRNNGDTPLIMLCIQYKTNTFNSEDANDGVILQEPVKW